MLLAENEKPGLKKETFFAEKAESLFFENCSSASVRKWKWKTIVKIKPFGEKELFYLGLYPQKGGKHLQRSHFWKAWSHFEKMFFSAPGAEMIRKTSDSYFEKGFFQNVSICCFPSWVDNWKNSISKHPVSPIMLCAILIPISSLQPPSCIPFACFLFLFPTPTFHNSISVLLFSSFICRLL